MASTAALTTMGRTLVPGAAGDGGYRRVAVAPGEPHVLRQDVSTRVRNPTFALQAFVQLSDLHVTDDQSPLRVEFLDRLANPGPPHFGSYPSSAAYRPQECMSTQVLDAMCRAVSRVGRGPRTTLPLAFAIVSGDGVDNAQRNELRWYIDVLNGTGITPNSGHSFDHSVTGDSLGLDVNYWHAAHRHFEETNQHGPGPDLFFQAGFPDVPQLPDAARRPFQPHGIGIPWFAAYGNHDVLVQGNVSTRYDLFGLDLEDTAVGDFKRSALTDPVPDQPPDGFFQWDRPEDLFVNWDYLKFAEIAVFQSFAGLLVPEDPDRTLVSRQEFVAEHIARGGEPVGHGFTEGSPLFYVMPAADDELVRHVVLDTPNPFLGAGGILLDDQWHWLEATLRNFSSRYLSADPQPSIVEQPGVRDRLIVLHAHHSLTTMSNDLVVEANTTHTGADLERLLLRYPNVILFVNGHDHRNRITPHRRMLPAIPGGFWQVNTASLIDWPMQSRLIELTAGGGTVSIVTTMLDHDAPVDWRPGDISAPATLASLSREVAANDIQKRDTGVVERPGVPEDRNAQLLLPAPFPLPDPPTFGSPLAVTAAAGGAQLVVAGVDDADVIRTGALGGDALTWATMDGLLRSVALGTNVDASLDLYGVNSAGTVFRRRRVSHVSNTWGPWQQLPGRLSSVAVARDGTGRIEVFGSDIFDDSSPDSPPGTVRHCRQAEPGGEIGPLEFFAAPTPAGLTSMAAATTVDGRIAVFGVTYLGGSLVHRLQSAPGDWTGTDWVVLDSGQFATVAATTGPDGVLQLFAADQDGRVFARRRTGPGPRDWADWQQLDQFDPATGSGWADHDIRQLAVGCVVDGLVLLAVDADGDVLTRTAPAADPTAWGPWSPLPGRLRSGRLPSTAPRALPPGDLELRPGTPVTVGLHATGGTPPYSWQVTGLPAGLTATAGGTITGVPVVTGAGTVTVTATVTDGNHLTDSTEFVVTLRAPVPDVRGGSLAEAATALHAAGFTVGQRNLDNSCVAAAGEVLSQRPVAGALVPLGSAITLTISSGQNAHGNPCLDK